MSKAKRITNELLDRISQSIRSLPVQASKGQEEAAKFLSPAFKFAMKKGYTLEQIQDHVSKEFGLTLQMSKLKKALAASESAKGCNNAATAESHKEQKQTDTPPATNTNENDSLDADTSPRNSGGEKTESQTDGTATTQTFPSGSDENANLAEVVATERVDLNCPKYQKDEAKDLGAKWDQANMVWYVPAGLDLTPFEKWLRKPLYEYQANGVEQSETAKDSGNAQNEKAYGL